MCTGENDLNTLSVSFFKQRKKIPGLDYQTLLRKTKTGPRRRCKSSVDNSMSKIPGYEWTGPKFLWHDQDIVEDIIGRQRQRQRERQKSNRFILAKQQHHAFLFISLFCRSCTTTTWKCLISRFVEDGYTRQQLCFFFSWTLRPSFRIQLQKNLLTFDELNEMHVIWNKRDKVWGNANSLLKWRFRSRRRPCCLNKVGTESWILEKA